MKHVNWLTGVITGASMLATGTANAQDVVILDGYVGVVQKTLTENCDRVIDTTCMGATLNEVASLKKNFDTYLKESTHPMTDAAQKVADRHCPGYLNAASNEVDNPNLQTAFAYALDAYVSCLYSIDEAAHVVDVTFEPETAKLLNYHVNCMRGWDSCSPADRFPSVHNN